MIDWHSHILPGVDDGSRDINESVSLLKMLAEQGVDTVIATPHFYANDNPVDEFLQRRNEAYDKLLSSAPENSPKILRGAEVRYYPGISRMENIEKLCIEGTSLFLLEMSMSHWTEYTVKELLEISGKRKVKLILAHIERYMKLQSEATWERLYENGILMQVNASFFTEFLSKRKALSLLSENKIHLIGSDCHNIRSRPPQMGKAYEIIEKKFGSDFTEEFNGFGAFVLKDEF